MFEEKIKRLKKEREKIDQKIARVEHFQKIGIPEHMIGKYYKVWPSYYKILGIEPDEFEDGKLKFEVYLLTWMKNSPIPYITIHYVSTEPDGGRIFCKRNEITQEEFIAETQSMLDIFNQSRFR